MKFNENNMDIRLLGLQTELQKKIHQVELMVTSCWLSHHVEKKNVSKWIISPNFLWVKRLKKNVETTQSLVFLNALH